MSTISIIGSGSMATAVAGRAAKAGHTVEVIGRNAAKAKALANQLGSGATTGTYGAAPAGDIVILAVPYASAAAAVDDFGKALAGKVVIDLANPVAADMSRLVTPHGSSSAQETAKALPLGAHVVKAFNTLFGHMLAKDERFDAYIAGDDVHAKKQVSTFLESLNLHPLDVGGLQMAQTLEALGLMMIGLAKNGAGTWNFTMKVDVA
jgi:predicted dinucleotide-binding enzyme